MTSIRKLDQHTINKIAAGEVIERPASVVKELIDNALDARATRLTIDLEDGGRSLIRLADDGVGMSAADLSLAVQNHATSKLRSIEDLLRIGTLGFRGEALASIAAVSRFVLTSRAQDSDVAHRIEVVDGQAGEPRPIAAPIGTTVAVLELFHNTPARREFLRAAAAERRAVLDVVCSYALANPQLQILLRADGRDLLDLRPAATLRERVADVLGRPTEQNLADVRHERDAVRVQGLASKPPYGQRNRSQQLVFVNGRPVRDRAVSFAITHAYRHTMPPDRFPVLVLFLTLPPEQVDVNVHPTKSEVRFRDERLLHHVLVGALRAATGPPDAAERDRLPSPPRADTVLKLWDSSGPARPVVGDGLEIARTLLARPEAGTPFAGPGTLAASVSPGSPAVMGAAWSGRDATAAPLAEAPAAAPDLLGDEALYWQLHNAYILIQIKTGLVVVDQHAAHERVLYDRALGALESRSANVQRLLFPITLELSVRQFAAYEESRELLDRLGFDVRPFGGRSVLVEGIPAEMTQWDEGGVLLGMLDDLAENRETKRLPLREKILATFACRAAIMQGKKLSVPEMRALMDALFATERPYTCPHGRPALLRVGLDDLDRKFGRSIGRSASP
jgi:DNA mismatch repair protein MutL